MTATATKNHHRGRTPDGEPNMIDQHDRMPHQNAPSTFGFVTGEACCSAGHNFSAGAKI